MLTQQLVSVGTAALAVAVVWVVVLAVQEYPGKAEMVAMVHHTVVVAAAVLAVLALTTTRRLGNTQMVDPA
jgi:hypothetical protein